MMPNTGPQEILRVAFLFPGAYEVITIQVDRAIGVGNDTNDRYKYSLTPELEISLSAVPGLLMDSVWTKVGRYSLATEYVIAFDHQEVCLNVALALAEYFGISDENVHITEVIDNRPLRNLMHQ